MSYVPPHKRAGASSANPPSLSSNLEGSWTYERRSAPEVVKIVKGEDGILYQGDVAIQVLGASLVRIVYEEEGRRSEWEGTVSEDGNYIDFNKTSNRKDKKVRRWTRVVVTAEEE